MKKNSRVALSKMGEIKWSFNKLQLQVLPGALIQNKFHLTQLSDFLDSNARFKNDNAFVHLNQTGIYIHVYIFELREKTELMCICACIKVCFFIIFIINMYVNWRNISEVMKKTLATTDTTNCIGC